MSVHTCQRTEAGLVCHGDCSVDLQEVCEAAPEIRTTVRQPSEAAKNAAWHAVKGHLPIEKLDVHGEYVNEQVIEALVAYQDYGLPAAYIVDAAALEARKEGGGE